MFEDEQSEQAAWIVSLHNIPEGSTREMLERKVKSYALIHPKTKKPMLVMTDKQVYLLGMSTYRARKNQKLLRR